MTDSAGFEGALGHHGRVSLAVAGVALISSASTAAAMPIGSVGVLFGVLVAVVAVGLASVDCWRGVTSHGVCSATGVFKVIGIHAQRTQTQVIDGISSWWKVSVRQEERVAMCRLSSDSADELPVPLRDHTRRPQPAGAKFRAKFWQRSVLVNLLPEALFRRFRGLARYADSSGIAFEAIVLSAHHHPLDFDGSSTSFDRTIHEGASFR